MPLGRPGRAIWAAVFSLSLDLSVGWTAATAGAPSGALKGDEAAVVGGWTGAWKAIEGIALQEVSDVAGCLEADGPLVVIDDHQSVSHATVDHAHRLTPGRWAVVGVKWAETWGGRNMLMGVSPEEGEMWVFNIEPGVVSDIGIWPVSSPYSHRYVIGEPEPNAAEAAAQAAASGMGPLVQVHMEKQKILRGKPACARPSKPAT